MADDKKSGYIYLDRSIQESRLWKEQPFSKGQAWIDLILLANYEDKKMFYKDKTIICKRGTVNLSVLHLADRWGWNRKTVVKFLKQLQDGDSIEYNPSKYRTMISIINYDLYQNKRTTKTHVSSEFSQNEGQRYGQRNFQKTEKSGQRNFQKTEKSGQRNFQKTEKSGQRSGQRNSTSVLGFDEIRDNEVDNAMDNAMDITKEIKEIKESKESKGNKENIDDSLFREEHNGLSREEWESGTRMMGQSY
jgi:hypothetical protein